MRAEYVKKAPYDLVESFVIVIKAPRITLRALLFHIYINRSIASSEKLPRINVYFDCKSILEVQFLYDNNCGIIRSLSE